MNELIKAKINRSDIPEEYREAFDKFKDDIYVDSCYTVRTSDNVRHCAENLTILGILLKALYECEEERNEADN